jgi:hypothetical protein
MTPKLKSSSQLHSAPREEARYFTVPGAHLYTVLHRTAKPLARVLLVGPFASERHSTYTPWVRWARYLAEHKVEVLRYDYRGIGESTGSFEAMSFNDWEEDLRLLAGWLRQRSPNVPLILNGLQLGALLAGRAFDGGVGDGLLLWAPPVTANEALRATLKRRVGFEQVLKFGDERKSASEYIRQMEQGCSVEVDGYLWSADLWRESFLFSIPGGLSDEGNDYLFHGKPVRVVRLDKQVNPGLMHERSNPEIYFNRPHADIFKLNNDNFRWHHAFRFWSEFKPYFNGLFADNLEWITRAAAI